MCIIPEKGKYTHTSLRVSNVCLSVSETGLDLEKSQLEKEPHIAYSMCHNTEFPSHVRVDFPFTEVIPFVSLLLYFLPATETRLCIEARLIHVNTCSAREVACDKVRAVLSGVSFPLKRKSQSTCAAT